MTTRGKSHHSRVDDLGRNNGRGFSRGLNGCFLLGGHGGRSDVQVKWGWGGWLVAGENHWLTNMAGFKSDQICVFAGPAHTKHPPSTLVALLQYTTYVLATLFASVRLQLATDTRGDRNRRLGHSASMAILNLRINGFERMQRLGGEHANGRRTSHS